MGNQGKVYICAAKRTAIGSFQGTLAGTPAPEMAANIVNSVLDQAKVPGESIDEVILGSVLTAGQGQAPARQVVIKSGLPNKVQAMTINKVCSSGLKAVMLAANNILLGQTQTAIAGGMENMSAAPYLLPKLRSGARLGHTEAHDSIIFDALWDVYNDYHMGNAAELCASEFKLSREEQDSFAIESYRRANEAIEKGYFKDEISPLTVKLGRKEIVFDTDEEPGRGKPEKIPSLKPVFQKDGTVTAANASTINDGAALLMLCSEEFVEKNGLKPLARIVSQGWNAQEPEWFTTAPVGAIANALANADKSVSEIDLFEVNEAFSAVALACGGKLEIPAEKLNVCGGAVALGHPVGASGARILITLIYSLIRLEKTWGAVGICNGGGEATAMVVERL